MGACCSVGAFGAPALQTGAVNRPWAIRAAWSCATPPAVQPAPVNGPGATRAAWPGATPPAVAAERWLDQSVAAKAGILLVLRIHEPKPPGRRSSELAARATIAT